MGNRYVSCWKTLFVFAAIVAVVTVPLSEVQAAKATSILGDTNGSVQPRERGYQDDSPINRPTTFSRSNYVWQYGAGPYYGDQVDPARQVPGTLATPVGTFQPTAQPLNIPDSLRKANLLEQIGVQHFIVMIDPNTRSAVEIKDAIAGLGGVVLKQMDQNSWVVRLNRASHGGIVGTPGVLHIEPYHPAFKLHPNIGRMPVYDPLKAVSESYDLNIALHDGEDAVVVAQAIAQLGGTVTLAQGNRIQATVHRAKLGAIAGLEPVFQIFERLPRLTHGEETTSTMQAGSYISGGGGTPYHDQGIDGSGGGINGSGSGGFEAVPQVLMVLDSGFQLDAADLSDSEVDAGTAGPTHRKVVLYQVSIGGSGDSNGCDAPAQGGFTHGHVVAATALGDAQGDFEFQTPPAPNNGQEWRMVGVAPGAQLAGYDGSITPPSSSCADPLFAGISSGLVYSGGTTGSLGQSYLNQGARVFNFSWGTNDNAYDTQAAAIDDFHWDKGDALVFISAGNAGADDDDDTVPDAGTTNSPATTINGLAIGASYGWPNQEGREFFSSSGPLVNATSVNRVGPQLMAPGGELGGGTTGFSSEFTCRSNDNDQENPVECDVIAGVEGTSFASPAAAGAALLVRDYFAQGFHPDGTATNLGNPADQVASVSGRLVKAALIASADYMTAGNVNGNGISGADWRFNNEQGYGRIQLDNVLPLETWARSPLGLLVHDEEANLSELGFTSFTINSGAGETLAGSFDVCNGDDELRVALTWFQPSNGLGNSAEDLLLTLTSPNGLTYNGNFFTDDANKSGAIGAGEDCTGIDGNGSGQLDTGRWSIPINGCDGAGAADREDTVNPTAGIFLSPHASSPRGTGATIATCDEGSNNGFGCSTDVQCPGGTCTGGTDQVEEGTWTISVEARAGAQTTLPFSVVVAGGVCSGSSARFNSFGYTCNQAATVTVTEVDDALDPELGLTELEIESRTTVRVFDANDVEVDCEGPACAPASASVSFTKLPDSLKFVSDDIQLTSGTNRQFGNGVLDVRNGDTIDVRYQDKESGLNADIRRNLATVNCEVDIDFGGFVFGQFGQDSETFVSGGCERNARGQFDFGFPDRYMDSGELLHYNFGFQSRETVDIDNVVANLRCVIVDPNSPADCAPDSDDCADPRREDNPTCTQMDILDTPKLIGSVVAGAGLSANFSIQMATFTGTPTVEMVLEISADISGKTAAGIAVDRQRLNVDELSVFYSTDFPSGGTEAYDINNDEVLENPTTQIGAPPRSQRDYYFENRSGAFAWSAIDSTGKNTAVAATAPWNFDGSDGGFTTGLVAVTNEDLLAAQNIANWGEDKNFNGVHDGTCVSDPSVACQNFPNDIRCPTAVRTCQSNEDTDLSGGLDDNWNTEGGCGWQTLAPHFCSGNSARGCFDDGDCAGTCFLSLNPFESTRTSCAVNTDCSAVSLCANSAPAGLRAQPCTTPDDCGGANCNPVPQACVGAEGTCNLGSTMTNGGVWHTGDIGPTSALDCADRCGFYDVINTTGGNLLWWELLTTPVIEKVDTTIDGGSGLPNSQAEILAFDWNQSINLASNESIYTWEVDTDVAALLPVDLKSDGVILNSGGGAYGAVASAGNPELTDGFSLFAPISTCSGAPFGPCVVNEDCAAGTCTVTVAGSDSVNGTVGLNRVGDNSCFFDGAIPPEAYAEVGITGPPDNDQNEDGDGSTDEFVTDNGPIRNATLMDWNGPDMRFSTLEDIYGDTGDTFQGGIGFLNTEGTTVPDRSFGLAVDDVVLRWREFSLAADATECAISGSCATIDVDSVFQFSGNEVIEVTVLDECPYGPAGVNNCNGDRVCTGTATDCAQDSDCAVGACSANAKPCNGFYDCDDPYTETCVGGRTCDPDYTDAGDDTDCDDDGTNDVVIKATIDTQSDPEGSELIVANQDPSNPNKYTGELSVSSTGNSAGVLFVAPLGTDNPTVTFEYLDEDDCNGSVCQNSVNPIGWGKVDVDTLVLLTTCTMSVINTPIADNGDGDPYADSQETVDMQLTVLNTCPVPLTNCNAVLTTNSDTIDCILDPVVELGDFNLNEARLSTDVGTFRVADIARANIDETLVGEFNVAISCDQFDALSQPQRTVLNLDLDVDTGGQAAADFIYDFEGGLAPDWTVENLDAGLPPDTGAGETDEDGLLRSDGMRCQLHDPDWPNSNSFGETAALDCYPGPTLASANAVYWTADGAGTGSPDGGRAYLGTGSMHFGVKLDATLGFTMPFAMMEGVSTTSGVNLGVGTPQLVWYHQVDMIDSRSVNAPAGESADRGVLQLQTVDQADVPTSEWIRLEPYFNSYDQQGTDNYTNCMFDPIDDGNTEDDFFDPNDPDRRLGPSSTCFPAFSYTYHGDTFSAFASGNLGNAVIGPGLPGSLGLGTWVEVKADLSAYKGQRVKLRFLETGLKLGTTVTVQQAFQDENGLGWNPTPGDDGWWIDQVTLEESYANPISLTVDGNDNSALPACGTACGSVTASVAVDPPSQVLSAPGQVVELDASDSSADRCVDGLLQYRFSRNGVVVRSWTDDPILLDAPVLDGSYTVEVRCSTDPSCADSSTFPVTVTCPGGTTQQVTASKSGTDATFSWGDVVDADVRTGSFASASDIGNFATTLEPVVTAGSSYTDTSTPAAGSGTYVLVKKDGTLDDVSAQVFCNSTTWSTGGNGEEAGRDADLGDSGGN